MNENHLLDAMSGIDPQLLQRSESGTVPAAWKKLLPLAACLCLSVGAAWSGLSGRGNNIADPVVNTPVQTEPTKLQAHEWEVSYNTETSMFIQSADRVFPLGYFTEELSEQELAAVLPGKSLDWMNMNGWAGFTGEGELVLVNLQVTTQIPDKNVTVILGDEGFDCVVRTDQVLSKCGDLEYAIYQYTSEDQDYQLTAYVNIGGVPARFSMIVPERELETAKADFEAVLECFAWYETGQPDLTKVKADVMPDWYYKDYTWEEAKSDAQFGTLWLGDIPAGFTEEGIRRHKDMHNNYLSGMWTQGLDYFSWRVWHYTDEDAQRLTSVENTKNYDLSLYPIPRAESVPEELCQVVNDPIFVIEELTLEAVQMRAYTVDDAGDSGGVRMQFSVKYGDKLVSISAKGVDPHWLYDQLKALQ